MNQLIKYSAPRFIYKPELYVRHEYLSILTKLNNRVCSQERGSCRPCIIQLVFDLSRSCEKSIKHTFTRKAALKFKRVVRRPCMLLS